MMRTAWMPVVLLIAGCAPGAPADPAMDREVRAAIASGMAVQSRMIEIGGFQPLELTGKRLAPSQFDGKDVMCAAKAEDGARVMVVDLVEFVDGPMQGAWFDYLWRRSGC